MSVSRLTETDRVPWEDLFRQYIAFYNTSLPEEQYERIWKRILDLNGDLHTAAIREDDGTLNGIAHYLFHTSSWSEKPVCYTNDLFVNPVIRGEGYGRMILVACGQEAEAKGCYKYYWLTQHENTTARKLYDTFGKSGSTEYRITLPSDKW